ncbi:MAG: DUF817 family protein [Fimbriimonadaceae bacterium]
MDRLIPIKGERLSYLFEFIRKHIIACTFPFSLVACLALTKFIHIPGIPRYDLLFVLCLAIQYLMVKAKMESWRDAGVVAVFHLLGLGLEIFKINQGSWSYPEFSYLKIMGAPLYSGFMHGSVASFMCLAWNQFDLKSSGWLSPNQSWPSAIAVYALFFSSHATAIFRAATLTFILLLFWQCKVHYTINRQRYQMPMSLAFVLIGYMIWIAENIATYLGAWKYPYQLNVWEPVHASKIVSWSLLMIVSLIIVAEYKKYLGLLTEESGVISQDHSTLLQNAT